MYKIFKHKIKINNIYINTYGIEIINSQKSRKLHDVSTNKTKLLKLIDGLNKENVDEIHLESILEDFYLFYY